MSATPRGKSVELTQCVETSALTLRNNLDE